MNSNLEISMWSSNRSELKDADLMLDNEEQRGQDFEPVPYTFTTVENGKKTTVDSSSVSPPSWLLLDHTLAVVWSLFSSNPRLQQLGIDDLKWGYEFLKEIRNKKGENPPDVKVCLEEIQDRLINLYAKLTSMNEEDFDELAAVFGEKIIEKPSSKAVIAQVDSSSLNCALTPSRIDTGPGRPLTALAQDSTTTTSRTTNTSHKTIAMNFTKKTFPLLNKTSNIFEEPEAEDEDIEKYFLSLFEDEKREDGKKRLVNPLFTCPPLAPSSKESLTPTHDGRPGKKSSQSPKRKPPTSQSVSEVTSVRQSSPDGPKREKTSKKVRCYAEMRSLKFQKSMKVQDMNGEEAAYSNLKAEIQRLTINPKVSKGEIMKFLKGWRSEQEDRLQNEIKRLNSIEEEATGVRTYLMKNPNHRNA